MDKIVVITGATSGLGKKLKEMFVNDNNIVFSISRTETISDTSYKCDISNLTEIEAAFDHIKEKYGKIDILINNAGYGISGATELISDEMTKKLFDVNFFGAINCMRYALPLMNKNSKIFNISSACAIFPLPYRTLYCASKSGLDMLSQSVAMELNPYGIKVVSICPGDIKTNFSPNRIKTFETNEKYENRIQNATSKIDNREHKRMSVDYAGKKIYKICIKKYPKPRYIIGFKYKLFYIAQKIVPIRIFNKILAKIFDGR